MTNINTVLNERGTRYGDFDEHAKLTQNLKVTMYEHPKYTQLAPYQAEALEMIQHKIGRIINGDPNYDDSWVDISGYATLVVDKLRQGNNERTKEVG